MNTNKTHKISILLIATLLFVFGTAFTPFNQPVNAVEDLSTEPIALAESDDLTDEEIEGMLFMYEEEKLAQDVYNFLYEQWSTPIFKNIGKSETQHAAAIYRILEDYGVEDQASTAGAGEFNNAELQDLYDELTTLGSESLESALLVGATIEEVDILDLEEYIANTDNQDILFVYQNLLKGSENHLRSFTSLYNGQSGETYAPQYMSQEAFDEVMQGKTGRSGWNNGRGGSNNGNWRNNPAADGIKNADGNGHTRADGNGPGVGNRDGNGRGGGRGRR